ncbi:hypothetical protein Tco_0944344, partial [Tanacetum coccineum]
CGGEGEAMAESGIGFEGLGGTSMISSKKGVDGYGESVSLEEGGED